MCPNVGNSAGSSRGSAYFLDLEELLAIPTNSPKEKVNEGKEGEKKEIENEKESKLPKNFPLNFSNTSNNDEDDMHSPILPKQTIPNKLIARQSWSASDEAEPNSSRNLLIVKKANDLEKGGNSPEKVVDPPEE